MDPTTTLMTFMLQTSSHTRSVQLVGSWDNFIKRYPMEKDVRRGRREWRGCYSFKDITCDGDNTSISKRNGGLKMGHTYYYYYEIDDSTEIYDPTLPFTTACQYLPGQPVNFLWVPVEENPLRERSASVGATDTHVKTMNPADKYLTPRAPPPTAKTLPRLNTSPGIIVRKRGARSTSPARSPWSARAFFGLKSPVSASPYFPECRQLLSASSSHESGANIGYPTLVSSSVRTPDNSLSVKTSSRETPSSSTKYSAQRDGKVVFSSNIREMNTTSLSFMAVPRNVSEVEFEDDDNFASISREHIDYEKPVVTSLSPPPLKRNCATLPQLTVPHTESKPLPMLPEDASPSMVPSPLHIKNQTISSQMRMNPKSHFSLDSIATTLVSPAGSQYDSSSPLAYDSNDEYVATDHGFDFGFPSMNSSTLEDLYGETQTNNFYGYSLPFGPGDALDKHHHSHSVSTDSTATIDEANTRTTLTFGSQVFQTSLQAATDTRSATTFDELFKDLGYLGNFISGG